MVSSPAYRREYSAYPGVERAPAFTMPVTVPGQTAGLDMTDVHILAGSGTRTPLKDTPRLDNVYGGDPTRWQKMQGFATIEGQRTEFHWYENSGNIYEVKEK